MCKIGSCWESSELNSVLCDDPEGWDLNAGMKVRFQMEGNIGIHINDSQGHIAEINTTL